MKSIEKMKTETELTAAYEAWCSKKGYECVDANELFHELLGKEKRPDKDLAWLEAFMEQWDKVIYQTNLKNQPSIAIKEHWHKELGKLRCWISGFKAARNGDFPNSIPGEDTLRQIQLAIEDAA